MERRYETTDQNSRAKFYFVGVPSLKDIHLFQNRDDLSYKEVTFWHRILSLLEIMTDTSKKPRWRWSRMWTSDQCRMRLQTSKSGISEIITNSQSAESVLNSPNYSRRRKLQHRIIQRLIRVEKEDQWKTIDRQVMNECDLFNFESVDNRKCMLQEHGMKGLISIKKPALN